MRNILLPAIGSMYRSVMKPMLFKHDPEVVHLEFVHSGERFGESGLAKGFFSLFFRRRYSCLSQRVFDLDFAAPVGLAAGFDYEARLTQVLPSLGFGFGTVGTLTNGAYEGNARPMLGRLPKSKSLMVNKGFKNLGVGETLEHLNGKTFAYPVGISIGKTNTETITTQAEAVADVKKAFQTAQASTVPFSYYELNISCPNLKGSIEFYDPTHLTELLDGLSELNIKKPVFVKMPISKTDEEIIAMMHVIVKYSWLSAVVIGNLQRDRANPAIDQEEVAKFSKGNFSGVPCRARSNELIELVYKNFGDKIRVIGCGGISSAEDAYEKILLGASLLELITGMIFEGPQLIAEINEGVARMLKRDGYVSIKEAVGKGVMGH